jgi:hypothetical protein
MDVPLKAPCSVRSVSTTLESSCSCTRPSFSEVLETLKDVHGRLTGLFSASPPERNSKGDFKFELQSHRPAETWPFLVSNSKNTHAKVCGPESVSDAFISLQTQTSPLCGRLPLVNRYIQPEEVQIIEPGAVFVFDPLALQRWRDYRKWSPGALLLVCYQMVACVEHVHL